MQSSEMTRPQTEAGRMKHVLKTLAKWGENTVEKKILYPEYEAKVERMRVKVSGFKARWEEAGEEKRQEIVSEIYSSHKSYINAQNATSALESLSQQFLTTEELAQLDKKIRLARAQYGLLVMSKDEGPKAARAKYEWESLVKTRDEAVQAQSVFQKRFKTQSVADLNKQTIQEEVTKSASTLEEVREMYQAQLAGFLFARNKEEFIQKKSQDAFDPNKEQRQIEGVIRALQGQHMHMGTGEGKSTVVLPITSLIEVATGGDRRVIVGSANALLVDELKENTQRMSSILEELPQFKGQLRHHDIELAKGPTDSAKLSAIVKDKNTASLTHNDAIESRVNEDQKEQYWESVVAGINPSDNELPYLDKTTSGYDLYFSGEKELVWQWMDNKKKFASNCPLILMDEAHVAFDKGTPYSKTLPTEALSSENIRTGTINWLLHYVVAQELQRIKKPTVPYKGGHTLSEEGQKRIESISTRGISLTSETTFAQSFFKGVEVIADALGVTDRNARAQMKRELLDGLREYTKIGDQPRRRKKNIDGVRIEEPDRSNAVWMRAGEQIAQFIQLQDKDFTQRNGKVVLRDRYVDELLEEHKYNPDAQTAVLAVTGVFEPIKRELAFNTTTYPSFIHAMKDRFTAFSGTLMYPDARKNEMVKGGFASFLEDTTGQKVHMVEVPEIKPFPRPVIALDREEMYINLLKDIQNISDNRPTLVVDFNGIQSAFETYKRLEKEMGTGKVRLLLSRPTGGDKQSEIDYRNELDECRRALANGEIDALVSSGSAALGVNFEKSNGSFPDLKTVMIGLPDSEQRITQTIGRRRLAEQGKKNHSWHMALEDLEIAMSNLEEQTKKWYIGLKPSIQQMEERIMRDRDNPDKSLNHILDLLSELRAGRATDTDYQIMFDNFIDSEIFPHAEKYMKRKIALEILHYDNETINNILDYDELGKEIDLTQYTVPTNEEMRYKQQLLETYYSSIGLPSTLYHDIQQGEFWASTIREWNGMRFAHEQNNARLDRLREYISKSIDKGGFGFDTYLDSWYESSERAIREYAHSVEIEKPIQALSKVEPGIPFGFVYAGPVPEAIGASIKLRVIGEDNNARWEHRSVQIRPHDTTKPTWINIIVVTLKNPTSDAVREVTFYNPVTMELRDIPRINKAYLWSTPITVKRKIEGSNFLLPLSLLGVQNQ